MKSFVEKQRLFVVSFRNNYFKNVYRLRSSAWQGLARCQVRFCGAVGQDLWGKQGCKVTVCGANGHGLWGKSGSVGEVEKRAYPFDFPAGIALTFAMVRVYGVF
jgi:hypothetical protein